MGVLILQPDLNLTNVRLEGRAQILRALLRLDGGWGSEKREPRLPLKSRWEVVECFTQHALSTFCVW